MFFFTANPAFQGWILMEMCEIRMKILLVEIQTSLAGLLRNEKGKV